MRERGRQADLALEPGQRRRIRHAVRPDQLDGAGALQELVLGQVDLAHPAAADAPPEAILAELPGLGDLPPQSRDHVGPRSGADGQDDQGHEIEAEEPGVGRLTMARRQPEPAHRLGMTQVEDPERREGQQCERPDHQRGAAPALRDVERVGEDQDGGEEHDVLRRQLRHERVAAHGTLEDQPIQDGGDPPREHPDHAELQAPESDERDGPPAGEQGDDAHEQSRLMVTSR